MFSDVTNHSKQRKTTKLIKLQWIASIWCQNDKNNSKLQTRSNYDQFASIWRQNDQKHWCTVAKHSEQRKTTKLIKLQWIASIWHQNNQKCWDTSQNIQNNAKLQNWSNYNELLLFDVETIKTTQNYKRDQITINLHRFDIKTIQNVEIRRKTFNTTQTNESDQIIVHCIDLTSKR